jgi:hypothetical protein
VGVLASEGANCSDYSQTIISIQVQSVIQM